MLVLGVFNSSAQDMTNATAKGLESTAAEEALRSYVRLQEQLHGLQLRLDQSLKDAGGAAERNSELVAARLQLLEQSLAAQRAQVLESMQSSNRLLLLASGVFGAFAFLAIVAMAYLQWRTINRLAEIAGMAPGTHLLGAAPALNAPGRDEKRLLPPSGVESLDSGLPLSFQQLEKRILQLEHSLRPGDGSPGRTVDDIAYPAARIAEQESKTKAQAGTMNRLAFLLGRGESLLNLGKPQEALASFDEALSLEANYGEALVKKGLALEQLGKNEEALECYDRAIAADGALTVAYLRKGGLYNRMERHGEALQCYERALRTQEQRRG